MLAKDELVDAPMGTGDGMTAVALVFPATVRRGSWGCGVLNSDDVVFADRVSGRLSLTSELNLNTKCLSQLHSDKIHRS